MCCISRVYFSISSQNVGSGVANNEVFQMTWNSLSSLNKGGHCPLISWFEWQVKAKSLLHFLETLRDSNVPRIRGQQPQNKHWKLFPHLTENWNIKHAHGELSTWSEMNFWRHLLKNNLKNTFMCERHAVGRNYLCKPGCKTDTLLLNKKLPSK